MWMPFGHAIKISKPEIKTIFLCGETPGNKYDIQTVDIIYHNLATGSDTLMYRKGLLKPLGPNC